MIAQDILPRSFGVRGFSPDNSERKKPLKENLLCMSITDKMVRCKEK